MAKKKIDTIREQAVMLAEESKRSEPQIIKLYWFPDDEEVHPIGISENTIKTRSGEVEAFYFPAEPDHNITVPSGIAIIRPDEYKELNLPEGWGGWTDGTELEIEA